MNSSAILDIVILAVLAVFALLGAKKGFFRILADAFMVLLASAGARIISTAFAAQAAAALAPIVREQVMRRLETMLGDTLGDALGGALLEFAHQPVEAIIAQATEELTLSLARSLLFMLSFALLLLALRCFAGATNLLLRLPVLRQCNALLGAAVGLALGCLLMFIVIRVCLTWYIPEEVASGSILMGLFGGLPVDLPGLPDLTNLTAGGL